LCEFMVVGDDQGAGAIGVIIAAAPAFRSP
jgi:hypothetical protein